MNHSPRVLFGLTLAASTAVSGYALVACNNSNGSGGHSSSSTTGAAMGCMTGAPSCSTPADCPAAPGDCLTPSCDQGCCSNSAKAARTTCSSNGGKFCDDIGHCVLCLLASDCPAQTMTACKTDACNANVCGTANAASGTTCNDNGGKVCDSSGKCAACLKSTDCPTPTTACKVAACTGTCGTINAPTGTTCNDSGGVACDGNGSCVASHCMDGIQDSDETDTDCGGSCGPCADTKKCKVAGDCTSKVCDATLHCAVPTCSDGVQNGNETDKDCGGAGFTGAAACPACADKLKCSVNTDCANNLCFTSGATKTCSSCMDGAQDGNETGSDCGGLQCDAQGKLCANGQGCSTAADCTSGFCQGTTCALRPNGNACTADNQCANAHCVGATGNQICCSTACNTTCQACTMALTGQPDGTCANLTAGLPAPAGQCTAAPPCGNTGNCTAGGGCEQTTNGTSTPNQTSGNCQKVECDGTGGTKSVDDPTNLPPPSGSTCRSNPMCSGSPSMPSYTNAPTGTACTNAADPTAHVCGDTTNSAIAGTCVQCNTNTECNLLNDAGIFTCNTATGKCQ